LATLPHTFVDVTTEIRPSSAEPAASSAEAPQPVTANVSATAARAGTDRIAFIALLRNNICMNRYR
jgi:hypothetical protein